MKRSIVNMVIKTNSFFEIYSQIFLICSAKLVPAV
jgi:hypothetical protein